MPAVEAVPLPHRRGEQVVELGPAQGLLRGGQSTGLRHPQPITQIVVVHACDDKAVPRYRLQVNRGRRPTPTPMRADAYGVACQFHVWSPLENWLPPVVHWLVSQTVPVAAARFAAGSGVAPP